MTTAVETVAIVCTGCQASKQTKPTRTGLARLPRGWHRLAQTVLCKTCWKARYMARAVTFAVAGPVGAEWSDFRKALATAWGQSTALANWVTRELAKADTVRTPKDEKLDALPRVYLYPAARRSFPEFSTQSLVCVLNAVAANYTKARLETVWRSEASLRNYRYPYPYPVDADGWKAFRGDGGERLVSLRLGGERFTLRLGGGRPWKRQAAVFDKILADEVLGREAAVYRVRANPGDHRNGTSETAKGGGPRTYWRVMLKLAVWLAREKPGYRAGTMQLRTTPDSFLVAEAEGREPWVVNADHVRRWHLNHRAFLQRISEDSKYEKRWPRRARLNLNAHREDRCRKYGHRIGTFLDTASKMVAEFARRQGIATVEYDDSERGYLPEFPYHRLKELLTRKLDERGITLHAASGEVVDENPDGARRE